jgi:plastocyanin
MRKMPGHARSRLGPPRAARSRCSLCGVVLVLALGLGATGSAAAEVGVSIVFRSYQPAATTVNVGETVKWTNLGFGPHTVTALGGLFNSGRMEVHETFSVTFTTPGTYLYACTIHPSMKGTVIVRSTQAPQVVQASVSRHKGAHGSQTLVHVQAPRPGATVILQLRKGSAWRRVAQGRLSSQGRATLTVSSSAHRTLRVLVLGQPGESTLISRVLRPPG